MSQSIYSKSDDAEEATPRKFHIRRMELAATVDCDDLVAPEEPLDIRIAYWIKKARLTDNLALTMRTPGADQELTAGLLVSEGVIARPQDLVAMRFLGSGERNEMLAELAPDVDVEAWRMRRNGLLGASCGLCGKATREQIVPAPRPPDRHNRFPLDILLRLPALLKEHQSGFAVTGGLHAAALVTPEGVIEKGFEDIGRHNALDKLIGWCLLHDRLPIGERLVMLSSRSSFELVQKVAMAGGSMLATVGGPSSLAVESARELGITLVGFIRDGRCNVYAGEWRIHSK